MIILSWLISPVNNCGNAYVVFTLKSWEIWRVRKGAALTCKKAVWTGISKTIVALPSASVVNG